MPKDWIIYLITFFIVVGLCALTEALYMGWVGLDVDRKVKVKRRLRLLGSDRKKEHAINLLREPTLSHAPALNKIMLQVPRFHVMDKMLERAGLEITVAQYLGIQAMTVLVLLAILVTVTHGRALPLTVLVSVLFGIGIPYIYVSQKQKDRIRKLTEQLPDALDFMARSMRAGNPFSASLKGVAEEMPDPIAAEVRTTFDEMNFGLDLDQALYNLGDRTGSEELRYFITAVLIQRTTGGNLAEVLTRLAGIMRARANMVREVRVISTEMNYSAKVLIALPFFMALIIHVVNPDYMAELTNSRVGLAMIGVQIMLMIVGSIVIHRMIHFRI